MTTNTSGTNNVAIGAEALYLNTIGDDDTATRTSALFRSTASFNTAHGATALYNTKTGGWNHSVGDRAGLNNTTGSYNIYFGAGVHGTAADTNTIRIGVAYDSGAGSGQSQTSIAGIWGKPVTGTAAQVFVDASGRLGMGTPVAMLSGTAGLVAPAALEQQLLEQRAINDELRARIARLEATVAAVLSTTARHR